MKKLFLVAIAAMSLIMFSCNKQDNLISTEDEAIIANDAAAEAIIETADYEVDLYSGSEASILLVSGTTKTTACPFLGRYVIGQCPEITIEKTDGGFPITITLNYGDGVELINGTIIKGTVVIFISAAPRTAGAYRTVTFNDFYIDNIKITGTRTITFIAGIEGIGFTVVGDMLITFPNGTYIERDTEKTRLFVEGFDTPALLSDDKFQMTGFTSSVSSEGYSFSATITEPLIRVGTCRFIVQGVVVFTRNDNLMAELNYGDGTCDDIATITKDGETRQITLGKWRIIRTN
jgi:hypothetical protein